MVEGGQKMKYEITTSLFSWQEHHILGLLARPYPYLKISVAGVTGELVTVGVSFLTHREILGCAGLLILTDSSQRPFSKFWILFLEHNEDGPHTLLNGGS
jgi:hypothetical protein